MNNLQKKHWVSYIILCQYKYVYKKSTVQEAQRLLYTTGRDRTDTPLTGIGFWVQRVCLFRHGG